VRIESAVASTSTPSPKPGGTTLPPETVRRWKDIVLRAAVNGHNISNLVQQFAEQAFNNKAAALTNQGMRRRAAASLRKAVYQELERAQKFLDAQAAKGPETLSGPFAAVTIAPRSKDDAPKPAPKRRTVKQVPLALTREAAGYKATPHEEPLRTRSALAGYIQALTAQLAQVDSEIAQIDAVLNKGLQGQQSLIDELANTSRELYRIAQETIATANLPQRPPPGAPAAAPEAQAAKSASQPALTQSQVGELPKPLSEEATAGLQEAPQSLPELQSEVANLIGHLINNVASQVGNVISLAFAPLDVVFGTAEKLIGQAAVAAGTVLVRAEFVGAVLLRETLRAVYMVLSTLAR
ncbi:MAG TPA: hypothetical protein VFH51_11785, partial [Myxococcota bacterium]|nr:hypothetical protein [Myxococcota bacterium]